MHYVYFKQKGRPEGDLFISLDHVTTVDQNITVAVLEQLLVPASHTSYW